MNNRNCFWQLCLFFVVPSLCAMNYYPIDAQGQYFYTPVPHYYTPCYASYVSPGQPCELVLPAPILLYSPAAYSEPFFINQFDDRIIKPIRGIINRWHSQELTGNLYWQIRLVIHDNMDLFMAADFLFYVSLIKTIEQSFIPKKIKKELCCYLEDHFFNNDYSYYVYTNGERGRAIRPDEKRLMQYGVDIKNYNSSQALKYRITQYGLTAYLGVFDYWINGPIVAIVKKYKHKNIDDADESYAKIREVIEKNIGIYLNQDYSSYAAVVNTIEYSQIPSDIKDELILLLEDFYFRFRATYSKYHDEHYRFLRPKLLSAAQQN